MRQQSFGLRAAPSLVGGLSLVVVASRMNPWRGVVSLAEYRTSPYRTLLQDHKPATILHNSSGVTSQISFICEETFGSLLASTGQMR